MLFYVGIGLPPFPLCDRREDSISTTRADPGVGERGLEKTLLIWRYGGQVRNGEIEVWSICCDSDQGRSEDSNMAFHIWTALAKSPR